MKVIKKILIILLMVVMCVSLTACEDKDSKSSEEDETLTYIKNKNNNKASSKEDEDELEDLQTTSKENSDESDEENTSEIGEVEEFKETGNFMNDIKNITSEQALEKAAKQMAEPNEGDQIAIFHIKGYGDITVKFFEDVAPKAVENFVTHAKEGYYDGVIFHRVIEEFMIQGGDPQGTGYGGESIWGEGFEEELSVDALPYRGALCMASGGTGTKSLGSQFYIVQANYRSQMESYMKSYGLENFIEAYKKYGGDLADLVGYGQYTTFGQVIDGMDVVDKIAKVETNSKDKPLSDVVIESIEITKYSK